MCASIKKDKKLFLDIETVAQSPVYRLLNSDIQALWDKKAKSIRLSANGGILDNESLYEQKAGIFAEFGKVVVISCRYEYNQNDKLVIEKHSFASKKEHELLTNFANFLNNEFDSLSGVKIIGHNIREFDIPYLARRMIINEIKLPKALRIGGKRPWQIDYLYDTLCLWKFGDFKNYTSLNLLAKILSVPSPKEDLDGGKVHNAFWLYNDLDAIVKYCELDVMTTAKIFYKLKQKEPPKDLINL